MADDQFRQVNGPHGPINFPSNMSDDDVTQAMRKLYPPTNPDVGSISAWHPSVLEKLQAAVPLLRGRHMTADEASGPLISPEKIFSPMEQEAHPIRTGFDEFMGSLTSPDNLMLMHGLGALGMAPNAIGKWLPRIASGVFGAQMGKGSVDALGQGHQLWQQYKTTGDERYKNEALRIGTEGVLNGAMAGLSALHATRGTREAVAPKGVAPPAPLDTPIAASGKMESEAVNSSPRTGSSPSPIPPEVSAVTMRPVPKDVIGERITPPRTVGAPLERGFNMASPDENPLAGARANLTSPPESGIIVSAGEEKPVFTPRDLQQSLPNKPVPKLGTSPKLELVRPSTPPDTTRLITDRMMQLRRQGLSDSEQVFHLTREFPDQTEDIIRGYKAQQIPQETPSTAQAVQPQESVPATAAPEKAGESVPPTPRPEVARSEPRSAARSIQGLPDLDIFNKRVAEMLKKTPGMAEGTAKRRVAEQIRNEQGAVRFGGDDDVPQRRERKISAWMNRLSDPSVEQDEALRLIKNLRSYGLSNDEIVRRMSGAKDFAKGNENSDVTLSEKYQRRAFKGKLLREVIDPDKGLDANFKTISDYGWRGRDNGEGLPNGSVIHKFENANGDYLHVHVDRYDRIIGSRFEAANQDADESLEERIGDPTKFSHDDIDDLAFDKGLSAPVDRVMGKYVEGTDARLQYQAGLEGKLTGEARIEGVKDPAVEELDNIFRRLDPRKAEREDERGSLSFRRLPKEKREEYHPLARLADVLDKVANFFEGNRGLEPEAIADKKLAKNIIREAGSGLALSHLQVEAKLDDAIKRHDSPLNERENFISFMDAGEGKPGAQFLHPEDQALSNELHSMFEERWERVKAVKGLESDGIDNYLAHIWEKPEKAEQVLSGILQGKRPLEGSARFLKNRFYQFASTGIDHGLTPVSWNPIRLQLQALFDTDRFLMAHEIKDRFKDAGLASWVSIKNYKNVPLGWDRLNDKIFQPKAMGEGALQEYGTYYAPAEVAKVFNNYLSPGLSKSPLYRNVRAYQNRLNMINLGISAYHGTMIGLVASTSDLALGMQKVANNKDIGGIKDMLRGTIGTFILRSAAQDYKLGRDIQNEAISPTGKPQLHTYVDLLQQGGARFAQDPWYMKGMSDRKGFTNSLKLIRNLFVANSPEEAGIRGVTKNATALLDQSVRGLAGPIMDKYVPRIKLGAAARMMEAKLHHMVIEQGITDQGSIADEMGKIWDSIDNRAGQMVYDNLFWNKTAKDLSFLGVRAVGWDLGSAREYGGAMVADLPRQMAKGLRGERPELTSRLAFTMATPITIGIFGGALHYLMTGKAPQKPEDYFFPGPEGNKISFPSYMKDFYSFKSQPFKTAVNKLHPSVSQMYQMYNNADFYGTEIYHPGDDKFKQGVDILKWYGSTFAPLAVTGVNRRMDRGETVGSAASSIFGFMPAPASIGQTKAEDLAYNLAQRGWQAGPRSQGDAERHALVQKFQQQLSTGQKINKDVIQAWKQHRIQDSDLDKIYDTAKDSKLLRDFKELHLPDALAVMREANPSERVQLKPYLIDKYDEIDRYPSDIQHEYTRQVSSYIR